MFNTKLEVDKHVENCLKKVNSETERNLKCMAFAKLYFKVGDYEQARRYVTAYLTVKPHSAEGLSLLGKSLEKLGKHEAAIDAYRKSLDIDPKQNSLVIKVCELLASDNVNLDITGARYFCERAQTFDPHNPVVFSLKERLTFAESHDPADVAQLLLTELLSRPTDVHLRVRLLRHLLQNNQIKEAYKHAFEIEQQNLPIFLNNLSWYETVAEVLVRYQRDSIAAIGLTWEFWMLLVSVLDKLTTLTLDERSGTTKTAQECVSTVFNFDQTLSVAAKGLAGCNEQSLMQEFLAHYRAQLCFHLATLLFKQAKRDLFKYKEAVQLALPLLFLSYHVPPAELHSMWLDHSPEVRRQQIQRWHREAAFRCSQAGHILLAAAKDRRVVFMEKAAQSCSGLWREHLFKRLFITRDQQAKLKTSYFATSPFLVDVTLRLPDSGDLVKYNEVAELVHPDSLHHLIWICMNQKLSAFKCIVFDGLQYSVKHTNNCAAESLSVLDVEAFLYCATLCVQQQLEEMKHQVYYNSDKPNVLPAAITSQLGSTNQNKWLTAAYKMYRNEYGADMSELRLNLIRGIEVVRCVGNHGLDVKLLVILANTFAERAKNFTRQSEVEANEARAELYWKAALPLLKRLQRNQAITYMPNRLFEYKSKEMTPAEISGHIEEGKLFSAMQLMRRKENEKALQIFENLRSPYASFHQAQIYKTMADEQVNQHKENVTSEMRSQHIILLSRARDCLYLTLDRLRDPAVDRKHPLNTQLGTEIEKIERLLSRIDPDVYNHRNECDGMSDENGSSNGSVGDHAISNVYSSTLMNSFYPNEPLTPQYDRSAHASRYHLEIPARREARPSPERLDAQLRQIQASRDATLSHILEQNRVMLESHRNLVEELRTFRDAVSGLAATVDDLKTVKQSVNEELQGIKQSVDGLKSAVDELQNFRDVSELVHEMKRELAELKKDNKAKTNQLSDEDLYVLDEEYAGDYGINSNVAGFNPGGLYPACQPRLPPVTYPPALYPGLYPMYPYSGLGLPQPGTLPFGQEAQMSDFRTLNTLSQSLGQPTSSQLNLTQPKTAWDVGMVQPGLTQLGLMPGGVGPANLSIPPQPQPPQPHTSIFKDPKVDIVAAVIPTAAITSSTSIKSAPINVVITSSDPLPKPTVQTTQVLSVTIPPQHRKGNIPPKSQPHDYQIPLPASGLAAMSTTPTIVNQPAPVISTQGLLSNIAPPVYSAVETKSPSKSTGLGLQIEKSLSQSFSTADTSKVADQSQNKSGVSSTSIDDHDPCPDFKPLIPLPDEVPVNTGEENEMVLFCERAKLFRYANKEWRERGVGDIKILENKDTAKIRVLMRRDQVLKICANHFLTEDMTLTAMPNNSRAYIWAAHDFADEEMVLEKLCVKFKTEEEASTFYVAFENAKQRLKEENSNQMVSLVSTIPAVTCSTSASAKVAEPATSLGGFIFTSTPTFKPKEDKIAPKSGVQSETPKSTPFASFMFDQKTSTLTTPEAKPSQTDTTSKVNPFATFTFGASKTGTPLYSNITTPDAKAGQPASPKTPETPNEEFEPSVEFKPVIPLPELVEVKTGEENAEILFESRAKLLRYDAASKEWKERGVGIMKLLKESTIRLLMRREQVHKVCCNHQLLKSMQFTKMSINNKALTWYAQDFSEGVVKTEMFAIRFKSEEQADAFYKAVTSAQELLDKNNTVILDQKVAIPEIKCDMKSKEKTKEDKKVKSDPKILTPTDQAKPLKPKLSSSWKCKNCFVVNEAKSHYCTACDTPKNNMSPKKSADADKSGTQFSFGVATSTPNTITTSITSSWGDSFKPKEGSWECKQCMVRNDGDRLHCIACKYPKNDSVLKETKTQGVDLEAPDLQFNFGISNNSSKLSTVTTTATTSTWGDAFKPKPGSWECNQCLVRNDADKMYCQSCDAPKDDTVPKKEFGKGLNMEAPTQQFNFGMPIASASTPFNFSSKPATFTFGTTTVSPADSTVPAVSKGFSFSLPKPSEETAKPAEENREQFVFGSPQKHTFEFTPRSPRRHSSGCQGDEDSESFIEDEGDHIYFKPVIPLPDKIEVKTGEEQEEVVYCHRAKLFRFVDGEWKERGTGDIKILRNEDSGRIRVVMRREQVLKICLNHILTEDIKYLPKDDRTWLFSAPDFSEGEINHWQFCVRFKTADVAQEFKKAIDDVLRRPADAGAKVAVEQSKDAKEDDSDVEFVSETQVTAEEEKEALRLQLPPKFMAYRQLPDCDCDTCKEDDKILGELLSKAPPASNLDVVTSIFGTPCKPHAFSTGSSNEKFVFGNSFSFGVSAATPTVSPAVPTTTKSESVKELLMKPSVLANAVTPKNEPKSDAIKNFTFSIKTDTSTSFTITTTMGSLFSQTQTPLKTTGSFFGTQPTTISSTFSGTTTPVGSLFDNFSGSVSGGNLFSNSIFSPNTNSSQGFGTKTSGSIFGAAPVSNMFGNTPTTTSATTSVSENKPFFGETAASSPSFESLALKNEESTKTEASEDDVILKCDANLSFATLAASKSDTAFVKSAHSEDNSQAFAFLGSGAPVFASLAKAGPQKGPHKKKDKDKTHSGDEDEGSDAEAAEEYDPHYEPIVPLPEAIVVSTGEEEEVPLFNERAKLFRYDNTNKEWKERGVGQMKVLHHPVNGTYRLLLRREQVHKVVLNMLVTPTLELQPMTTSDKAWLWCGYNYTDDGSTLEKLAARFKNCELATQFQNSIQGVITTLKEQQENKNLPSTIQNYGTTDEGDADQAEGDDDDDDGDDNDDDDRTIMFTKHCELSEQLANGEWKPAASGELQLYYDPDIYGSRISVTHDSGLLLSSTLIGINTEMTVLDDHSCTWKAVEWAEETPRWRILKATFANQEAAEGLLCNYAESVQFAHESDLVDGIPC